MPCMSWIDSDVSAMCGGSMVVQMWRVVTQVSPGNQSEPAPQKEPISGQQAGDGELENRDEGERP